MNSKTVSFLVVLCISFTSWGQMQPQTAVTAIKANVLYLGVENPIDISPEPDKATFSGATVKDNGKGHYMVTPTGLPGSKCTVMAYKNGMLQIAKEFRVKRLPAPVMVYNGNRSGAKVAAEKFKLGLGLTGMLENVDFDAKIAVVSYTLVRFGKDGSRTEAICTGPVFSDAAKALVQKATAGDVFTFNDIVLKYPDAADVKAPGVYFEIIAE